MNAYWAVLADYLLFLLLTILTQLHCCSHNCNIKQSEQNFQFHKVA